MSSTLRGRLAWSLVIASFTLLGGGVTGLIVPAYSQTQPDLKKFNPEFVTEAGCPVEVTSAVSELELDPFGTPMAARHYIGYRNASGKPIAAVKFRIGYVADDGKIHQAYVDAPDAHALAPGEQAQQKWRGDRIDPHTTAIKMRVLLVKFADGSLWESQKLQQTNAAPQQQGFVPLTVETPDALASDRVPGTPVQFHDYGAQSYKGFPDRTATGSVPLSTTPGGSGVGGTSSAPAYAPAASAPAFAPAAAQPAAQPSAAAVPGADGFAGSGDSGFGSAPSNPPAAGLPAAAPAAAPGFPAAQPGAPTFATGSPARLPGAAAAGAPTSVPAAAPSFAQAPARSRASEPALPSDPLAAFDAMVGGKPKTPTAAPAPALGTTGGGQSHAAGNSSASAQPTGSQPNTPTP